MPSKAHKTFRQKLWDVIFNHNTFSSRLFDVSLLVFILGSSLLVILETVQSISEKYGSIIGYLERFIVIVFTVEYIARVYIARDRKKYILSLYGLIDIVAIVPAYLSLLYPPLYYLMLLRILRVFRIFRILKLLSFLEQETILLKSMKRSAPKIAVFLLFVVIVCVIFASFMYLVEGPANWFTDIPTSLYWTIVTLTTVWYGDITPLTAVGKILASIIMLSGYGIIAVPTGIVVSEYSKHISEKEKSL